MSQDLTVKLPNGKPGKPFSGYPLYAHASGRWAKKVRGKTLFFGPWDDPEGALRNWNAWKDDLLVGRTPRDKTGALALRDLVNQYLNSKRRMVANGEMVERTWYDYHGACGRLIRYFGKERRVDDITAADFGQFKASLYKGGLGHVSVANEVRRTRGLFKWGYDAGLFQNMPRYGQEFKKPSARVLRLDKADRPTKLFTADEIRRMIDAAGTVTLQTMVYLGVNAALGNHDIDEIQVRHLDLEKGWLVFPRPKTGVTRRCKLWPETISALRAVLNGRPAPKDPADKDRVFVTRCGARFIRFEDGRRIDAVHRIFAQLLRDLGIKRKGVSYYSLRHSFRTVCDGVDDRAAGLVMGHTPRENDMPTNYVHQVDDARIERVVRHVHEWLFGKDGPS